jgi:hypothetical protein
MGDPAKTPNTSWEQSFLELLQKHPDPLEFQQEVTKLLLDLMPSDASRVSRAIDKHDASARTGFLGIIFGDTARVQVLEALLHYPDDWFNLHDLATISGAGKASVKRIIDAIEASGLDIVEEKATEGTERERLVKLKDTQLARELRFFYMKLRGML